MRLVRAHMDYLTAKINDIYSAIKKLISQNSNNKNIDQFLYTIPMPNVTVPSLSVQTSFNSVTQNIYTVGQHGAWM